ncbi:MAG: acyltransferase [Gammaproteobacteria bacterium]|nr:acyltransferase [Gammaproteobacteria bacterium]
MSMLFIEQTKQQLKNSNNPVAKVILNALKALRCGDLPLPRILYTIIFFSHQLVSQSLSYLTRVLYWSPLFKSQINQCGKQLYLYGGMPYLTGKLKIEIGDQCRISGQTTFSGRGCHPTTPILIVGNNVDIGWMTTIAVGNKVVIGNNVRIADRAFLAGYPGHPLNAIDRANGLPETDVQVGDIILEDDVWLATGVSVMAGVTIGKGSIIAASSVVTKDIPAGVLAAGVPAKIVREL